MQSGPGNQPPYSPQVVPVQPTTCEKYSSKPARIVGILQIILGCCILAATITLYIVIFKIAADLSVSVSPGGWGYSNFWAPGLAVTAGILGLQSAKTKVRSSIIFTMVCSILSSITILLIVAQGSSFFYYFILLGASHEWDYSTESKIIVACFGIMLFCACVEFPVAIVAAALCCHGCCGQTSNGVAQQGMIMSPAPHHGYAEMQPPPYGGQYVESGDPNMYPNKEKTGY